MYVLTFDRKTGKEYTYFIEGAPNKIFLTEETLHSDTRYAYKIVPYELEGAQRITFDDFVPILFFDLGFERSISQTLREWIDSLI